MPRLRQKPFKIKPRDYRPWPMEWCADHLGTLSDDADDVTSGFIVWQGLSRFDRKPIVVIATTKSKNIKTGNMVQTYILRADVDPLRALKTGDDVSICGECIHRPKHSGGNGTCYVEIDKSVLTVWRKYRRGGYPHLMHDAESVSDIVFGRSVRIGAYGDPCAVPYRVWQPMLESASHFTGYTHAWKRADIRRGARWRFLMASADSVSEAQYAAELGFRTFRVKRPDESYLDTETGCPASKEWGERVQCIDCHLCDGSRNKKHVAINGHGRIIERMHSRTVQLSIGGLNNDKS